MYRFGLKTVILVEKSQLINIAPHWNRKLPPSLYRWFGL